MKTKTATLTGAALAYAVALADGQKPHAMVEPDYGQQRPREVYVAINLGPCSHEVYTVDSCRADDIIDREKISTMVDHSGVWVAYMGYNLNDERLHMSAGATRREAAMRCFVASRLGKDVEIPEELF